MNMTPPTAGSVGTAVFVPTNEVDVPQVVQLPQSERELEAAQPPPLPPKDCPPKKVIIFGETGTGKSSLVNMIADEPVAGVSNSARGYTFENRRYLITFHNASYMIYDTAGLNEGEWGTVPAQQALMNLKDLILENNDGVHLLVYCIRACRYRDILRVNYDLFHGIICQSHVPIVAVITGLEHASPMEQWWKDNERDFERYGLSFSNHACITATKGKKLKTGEHMFQEEYNQSQQIARELIETACSPIPHATNHILGFPQLDNQIAAYYERFNSRDGTEREALNPGNFIVQESQARFLSRILRFLNNLRNQTIVDRRAISFDSIMSLIPIMRSWDPRPTSRTPRNRASGDPGHQGNKLVAQTPNND